MFIILVCYSDIGLFLNETALELEQVFNSSCGFWKTHSLLTESISQVLVRIGDLHTAAALLCKVTNLEQGLHAVYIL